jgi:signal transduction histidine kinase
MAELPAYVVDYLNDLTTERRDPAYLLVNREGHLIGWGGHTEAYGLTGLLDGEPVGEQVFFLEALFPLSSDRLVLPCLLTETGRPAELHLFSTTDGDCALLLDATASEMQQRMRQQKGNELSLSYQRLVKEIQKKEVLLHCIVHDLGGPLMGIRGGFELLAHEDLSERGREFLEIGLRQAAKQEALIRDILWAFSVEIESLEAFTIDPEKAPDVLRAAKDVIELLLPASALNGITIRLDPDPPAPEAGKDWKVVGEKSRLERVISNLIENALRHSPANSTVTVGCHDECDQVLVTIDDQGPGVSPEIAGTLFQKFAQGKKSKGKLGLGLYFCRITVEHWGGEIGYKARDGGDTRFWFRLPRPRSQRENTKQTK